VIAVVVEVRESKLIEKSYLMCKDILCADIVEERRGKQSRTEYCRAEISRDDVKKFRKNAV
jgi:hypothetical protein